MAIEYNSIYTDCLCFGLSLLSMLVWRTALKESLPTGQKAGLFTVQCNKDNISLQGEVLSGLISFNYKRFRSPELRVVHVWDIIPLSTQHLPGSFTAQGEPKQT